MRYTVATIVIIDNERDFFGGNVSGFFTVQQNSKSGLPFVFFTFKDNFGVFLVEGFVFPVQAAQDCSFRP